MSEYVSGSERTPCVEVSRTPRTQPVEFERVVFDREFFFALDLFLERTEVMFHVNVWDIVALRADEVVMVAG